MGSFSSFLATLHPDTRIRGSQFEHFVKWFLKNDPEWATQVDQVWLWNDYPGQWGRDCGIDLVFKDKSGATWAVHEVTFPSFGGEDAVQITTIVAVAYPNRIAFNGNLENALRILYIHSDSGVCFCSLLRFCGVEGCIDIAGLGGNLWLASGII